MLEHNLSLLMQMACQNQANLFLNNYLCIEDCVVLVAKSTDQIDERV